MIMEVDLWVARRTSTTGKEPVDAQRVGRDRGGLGLVIVMDVSGIRYLALSLIEMVD